MEKKTFKTYSSANFQKIPQISRIGKKLFHDIKVVSKVLPFKVNNYVIDELIDWDNFRDDPIFKLTFPQKDMLTQRDFQMVENALIDKTDKNTLNNIVNEIRLSLNPNPAGQKEHNVPTLDGIPVQGLQHKYKETVLFFPSAGQTCHSYCTFCFRWPQFTGLDTLKFSNNESLTLAKYLEQHHEVTDILFTGGDPMIMSYKVFKTYIDPILESLGKTNIQTIRIGTKVLSYWPYKFINEADTENFLNLFDSIVKRGINLAFMAHFSHFKELETEAVKTAIRNLRNTVIQIRTQSPVLKHINDTPEIWSEMWRKQVNLNCIPYYMFVPRNTGAQSYFAVELVEAWNIFRKAYRNISGVCRTVRGPSMSTVSGKIQILGVSKINDSEVMVLRFLQGRKPEWVDIPFFAKYNKKAIWMSELKPAFGDKFFFEDEQSAIYNLNYHDSEIDNFE